MGSASKIRWLSSHTVIRFNKFPLSLFSYLESLPTGVRAVTLDAKDFISPRFNTNTTSTYCSNCGYKGHLNSQCAVTPDYFSNKTTAKVSKVWRVKPKTTSIENPSQQSP